MLSPANVSTRPSGSSVAVGYQRPTDMSGPRKYVSVTGLKIVVSASPKSALMFPPTISVRPSASWTWPEQKRFRPYGTDVNVPVAGFQSRCVFGESSQASIASTWPVGSSDMWTATSGQETGALHCPTWSGVAVTAAVDPPSWTSAATARQVATATRGHDGSHRQ